MTHTTTSTALFIVTASLWSTYGWAQSNLELRQRDHLLGDWGGARTWLEARGVSAELVYTAETFANLDGGIDEGADYRGDLSLYVELETAKAGWWSDGQFYLHLQEQHGHGITDDYVGDFQVLSNIDADDFFQLSSIWYRHEWVGGKWWIKVGKQDANEDFAFVEYGLEFINSSPGFSPTIPLVTYPDQDWGVVVGAAPVDWFSVNVGIYQGDPDGGRSIRKTFETLRGPMIMIEPAFHFTLRDKPGHARLGYWWNGNDIDRLDGTGTESSTNGVYATFDQLVFKELPEDGEDEQGIGLFGQFGYSDGRVLEAEQYYGAGLQWVGPIPERDEDVFGIGAFHVRFSDDLDLPESAETVIETFYKIQVAPWWGLKPDVQYIVDPGGEHPNAIAVGLRSELSF